MNLLQRIDEWQFRHIFEPVAKMCSIRYRGRWWIPAVAAQICQYIGAAITIFSFGLLFESRWAALLLGALAILMIVAGFKVAVVYAANFRAMHREFAHRARSNETAVRMTLTVFWLFILYFALFGVAESVAAAGVFSGILISNGALWCDIYFRACYVAQE